MEGGGVGGRGCWPCPIIDSGTVTAWRADLAAVFNFRGALSWWFAGGSASSAPMMAVVGLLCCALIIYVWCSIPSSLLRPAEVARGEGGGCGRSVFGGGSAGGLLLRRLCSGRPWWRGERLLLEFGRCGWWA